MDENQNNIEDVFSGLKEESQKEPVLEQKSDDLLAPQENTQNQESQEVENDQKPSNSLFLVILILIMLIGGFAIWALLK